MTKPNQQEGDWRKDKDKEVVLRALLRHAVWREATASVRLDKEGGQFTMSVQPPEQDATREGDKREQ